LLPHPFLSPQNDLRFASTSAATSSETEPWKIAHLMFRIKWFVTAQNSRPIHYLELWVGFSLCIFYCLSFYILLWKDYTKFYTIWSLIFFWVIYSYLKNNWF
jgi:hypothetical protein